MRRVTLLLFCAAAAWAQQPDPAGPDAIRLARIKYTMAENLLGLPNYTCVQTVERSRRKLRSKRFELMDTLRLEVALVGDKELFSWPGAGKFDDRELRDMVGGTGAIGNGSFGLHARSVFLAGAARFTFDGERDQAGRRVFAYHYSVPRAFSGYTIRSGDRQAIVGYHGTFLIDASSLDLIELVVQADDIPLDLDLAEATTTMSYSRVAIGSTPFLLPRSSELVMTDRPGNESRNRTTLSACRQYSGDSVLTFADPPSESEPAPLPLPPLELPAGLDIHLDLQTSVRYGASAIGEELTAIVPYDAKWRGKTIVPKGAIAHGHLLRAAHGYTRTDIVEFLFEFSELEVDRQRVPLHAQLLEVSGVPFSGRIAVVRPVPPSVGQGRLILSGNRLEMGKGLRMLWQVEPDRHGEK